MAQNFAGFISTKTEDYTCSVSDYTILVDASARPLTIYLPQEPAVGQVYNIKKIDSTYNKVTIHGNGRNIDGSPTVLLSTSMKGHCVQYCDEDGSWYII